MNDEEAKKDYYDRISCPVKCTKISKEEYEKLVKKKEKRSENIKNNIQDE